MGDYDFNNEGEPAQGLVLSSSAIGFLKETGKWARFLAIVGYVGLVLMVVMALSVGAIMSNIPTAGMMPVPPALFTVFYLFFAGLYFFPIRYLHLFSTNITTAINDNDNEYLDAALENLKSHYKYIVSSI